MHVVQFKVSVQTNNMRNAFIPLVLFLVPLVSQAAETVKPSLCEPGEKVVFSCSVSKKTVSLCSTPELSATSGRITYRFGVPGQEPELTYPSEQLAPSAAFSTGFQSWAKGSYSAVQFKRGEYVYTVYNRRAAFEEHARSNGGGVLVKHQGKQITDLWCENNTIQDKIWETLKKLELPRADAH